MIGSPAWLDWWVVAVGFLAKQRNLVAGIERQSCPLGVSAVSLSLLGMVMRGLSTPEFAIAPTRKSVSQWHSALSMMASRYCSKNRGEQEGPCSLVGRGLASRRHRSERGVAGRGTVACPAVGH